MKKRILFVLICVATIIAGRSFAQCVPDLSITQPGIYPDSATGLPAGTAGVPYSQVIQVKVLTDTTANGLPVIVTDITIVSVSGLPPGITYTCNPSNCVFPGGSNGCILLSGTPTVAGSFPMVVDLNVTGTLFGIPITQPSTVDYYVITINTNTGLPSASGAGKFELLQNKPNPATSYTDISFTSPIGGDFNLKIYNLIGKEVYTQTVRGMSGQNVVRINTDDFAPGVYMLSLNNGNSIVTRRMIVSRK